MRTKVLFAVLILLVCMVLPTNAGAQVNVDAALVHYALALSDLPSGYEVVPTGTGFETNEAVIAKADNPAKQRIILALQGRLNGYASQFKKPVGLDMLVGYAGWICYCW
jgi:hypothetical protein